MPEPDRTTLLEEAADIFLMLRETPEDRSLITKREAFLARGPAERAAYEEIANAWGTAAKPRRRPRRLGTITAAMVFGLLALGFGPGLYTSLVADIETGGAPTRIALASGDIAHLDARTAITDTSRSGARDVELLTGAAFFEVASSPRPFTVRAAGAEVRVLGTSFAVSSAAGAVWITVAEGRVEASAGQRAWTLEAGDRLKIAKSGVGAIDEVNQEAVAAWRGGRIITDGMTFGDVAAVIDRRIAGSVVILSDRVAGTRLTGGYDLARPLSALRAMAAVAEARIITVPHAVTIVMDAEGS